MLKTLMLAAAVAIAGCSGMKPDSEPAVDETHALGSWALYLPFDSMNAGHLILSKDADGKLSAVLLWRWGSPFRVEEARLTDGGFELRFGNHKPKDLPVEGITGGAMTPNEFVPGPLYIQGDHSDADFRNFILTPILN